MDHFKIMSLNTARSKDNVMAEALRDPAVLAHDMILIQEPWKNLY